MFPLRVLQLPNTLNKKSGVMSVVMNFYKNIDREKIQFDFLCFDVEEENYAQEITELGGKIYYIDSKYQKNPFKMKKEIMNFLKKHNYSIIHYHATSIWKVALKVSIELGIKNRIAHSHATTYSESRIGAFRNKILSRNLVKEANYYLACSTEAGELLFKQRKVKLLHNAIDVERFSYDSAKRKEYRKLLGLEGQYVIGHVGRFSEQKNHDYLIDLFSEYHKNNGDSKLLLVGNGPLQKEIEGKIRSLNLNSVVKVVGFNSEVENYYQAMDLFVMPSLYEGLPVAGIEAQASGLPCLFSQTISKEVSLCEDVAFFDITKEVSKNTVLIDRMKKRVIREKMSDIVREKNYDIKSEAKELQDLYLSMDYE
ncbi:hypothetical protein BAU15_14155 [Enterococcus sp. JM4C]|uniref:glycosyltransferase family 1 protein n=1 Tax=Candidatus Enterococcus huntleyi TaxID=1857217 RepID=UPI00137AE1F1|nr:glycosyltransferase family 1 protein [Enterococcus sp. JM4C]KAF1298822.1 hypothetical protein BAU15_14155 [Enterococcus sp. JM4C]